MATKTVHPLKRELGLTDREWEVFEHRLSCTDSFPDVFEEDYAREDVEFVAYELWRGNVRAARDASESIVRAIIRDCVEGSSWIACVESEHGYDSPKVRGAERTMGSLRRKVAAYLGVRENDVRLP